MIQKQARRNVQHLSNMLVPFGSPAFADVCWLLCRWCKISIGCSTLMTTSTVRWSKVLAMVFRNRCKLSYGYSEISIKGINGHLNILLLLPCTNTCWIQPMSGDWMPSKSPHWYAFLLGSCRALPEYPTVPQPGQDISWMGMPSRWPNSWFYDPVGAQERCLSETCRKPPNHGARVTVVTMIATGSFMDKYRHLVIFQPSQIHTMKDNHGSVSWDNFPKCLLKMGCLWHPAH